MEKNESSGLGCLAIILFFLLFFVMPATCSNAIKARYVVITRYTTVDLVGVPGDEIRFQILPNSTGEWSSSDGFSLRLQNSEYEFETTIVKPGERGKGKQILGSLIVPQAPGGGQLILTGTLWGDMLIGEKHTSLEVPVTLRIVPPGGGITTVMVGKRERQDAWTSFFIVLGSALGLGALAVWLGKNEEGKARQTEAIEKHEIEICDEFRES